MKHEFFRTTYCNQPHRLSDGKPINHECHVLPTPALHAEKAGDVSTAVELLAAWKKRKKHVGVKWQKSRFAE